VSAYNELLGIELLRDDRDAARALLQSHPLAAARGAIVARGRFASENEFYFGVAEEFARAMLGDSAPTGWGALLTRPQDWTRDRERLGAAAAFGQAAAALARMRAGDKVEGWRLMVEAGRMRLASLQEAYAGSVYASPMPWWTDRLLIENALSATFATGTPDAGFVVRARAVLGRSIETRPDDALALAAVQPSEERRRWAQNFTTIRYQQLDWERTEIAALARRLMAMGTATGAFDAAAAEKRRERLFAVGEAFVAERARLQQALASAGGGVEALADLATIQSLLHPDEALLLHVPLIGAVGKLCVRADSVVAASQPVDHAALATDARLLRLALTAGHPASVEADSQYPVAEAIRLARLLLDGLEACTRASRRLYVLGTTDVLVPPAALLLEPPPRLGAGYDLRAAHWLVRDHAFASASSIEAFVAARRLARLRTATLDYLGVGDPNLPKALKAAPSQSAGLAMRGSDALASLPELPETSQELEQVSAAFPRAKVRLLTRGEATEEAFRLQPLSEFDILHFATHGLVRQELPGISEPALVFSAAPGGDVLNDGLLGTSQIAALPLRARLAVLSACNSARFAPSIIDDGIQGLSLAFAIAGVPTTIAALWPIESAVTRDVVGATFRLAREERLPIADALAAALRRHLDGSTARPLLHPRFWAALVLLGDGALTFESDGPAVPRALGPFAPAVDGSDDVVSAAPLGGNFASSEIGPWNGTRSPSLIRRRVPDGAILWQVSDPTIGAGLIVASGDKIWAAGYEMAAEAGKARAVPVLRSFDATGTSQWSQRLPAGPQSTHVMGLAAHADESALVLVGATLGGANGARFSLLQVDASGSQGPSLAIDLEGDTSWGQSATLAVAQDAAIVAINRWPRPEETASSFDWRGLPRHCFGHDGADLHLVGLVGLQDRRRAHIDRLAVHDALASGDGWLLVGDEREACGFERHAALWRLNADGTTLRLWRDASPFDTFGRGVRAVADGFEIVGYARRSIAVEQEPRPARAPDFASRRLGDEAYASGEVFAVRLSEAGAEQHRDFVGAGLPVVPAGLAASAERTVVFGSVGGRALWLEK
jgi:hypothetical protein